MEGKGRGGGGGAVLDRSTSDFSCDYILGATRFYIIQNFTSWKSSDDLIPSHSCKHYPFKALSNAPIWKLELGSKMSFL